MATSQRSRIRKPESVQFWLCVGAVSLGLHSSLLFGLQRWAKVTIAQPDGRPIAVELVDAPDVVEPVTSPVEPDAIAQVPQTPDVKSNVKPEAKPEIKPDVQPEPEPELVRKPEPKRESKAPIASKPEMKSNVDSPKPILDNSKTPKKPPKDPKKPDSTQPTQSKAPKKPDSTEPVQSKDPIKKPPPDPNNLGSGSQSVSVRSVGKPIFKGQADLQGTATLEVPNFPLITNLPPNFPLRPAESLTVKLSFYVDNKTGEPDSPTLPNIPGLDSTARDQIGIAIAQLFQDLTFPPPIIKVEGGAEAPESTAWEITLQLTGQ